MHAVELVFAIAWGRRADILGSSCWGWAAQPACLFGMLRAGKGASRPSLLHLHLCCWAAGRHHHSRPSRHMELDQGMGAKNVRVEKPTAWTVAIVRLSDASQKVWRAERASTGQRAGLVCVLPGCCPLTCCRGDLDMSPEPGTPPVAGRALTAPGIMLLVAVCVAEQRCS
eukprot:365558-Chlamydomonas_euryale.AAC.16